MKSTTETTESTEVVEGRGSIRTLQFSVCSVRSVVPCRISGCAVDYLCFGREMWALTRKDISGESLALEAATLIAKWVARGLTQSML